MNDGKRKTVGVDPKVPIQAVVTAAVAVLAYFGIDLDPALSGAVAVVIGLIVSYLSPAPKTVPVTPQVATVEGGSSHVR